MKRDLHTRSIQEITDSLTDPLTYLMYASKCVKRDLYI